MRFNNERDLSVMDIKTEARNGVSIVQLSGRLDATTSAEAEDFLNKLISDNKINILINCTNLDYVSSAGLRVLLSIAKQLKRLSGNIGLSELNTNVYQIIEISGFTKIFPIFNTVEDALNLLVKKS